MRKMFGLNVGLGVLALASLLFTVPAQAATPEEVQALVVDMFGGYPPDGKMGRKTGTIVLNNQQVEVTLLIYKSPFERDAGKFALSVGVTDESDAVPADDSCFFVVVDVDLTGKVTKSESGRFCASGTKELSEKLFDKFGGDQKLYDMVLEQASRSE